MTDDAGSQDNTQIEKGSGYVARIIFILSLNIFIFLISKTI